MANNDQFSRTLSLLRQEKGYSQRMVAKELGISQALLSHYENGIREPGLSFVVKACAFYGVSADFLLGRTMSRDGTTIMDAEALYDASSERDDLMQGSVMATLSKKLLINSLSVIFDLLSRSGNKKAITAAGNYMSACVYTIFRHLYSANPANSQDFFNVPERQFRGGLSRIDMIYSEVEYVDALRADPKGSNMPEINNDMLSANYPGAYQSILQIIHNTGARMTQQMGGRAEKK